MSGLVFFFLFYREKYAGAALRILNAQTGIKNTGCRLPMEGIFYSKKKGGLCKYKASETDFVRYNLALISQKTGRKCVLHKPKLQFCLFSPKLAKSIISYNFGLFSSRN